MYRSIFQIFESEISEKENTSHLVYLHRVKCTWHGILRDRRVRAHILYLASYYTGSSSTCAEDKVFGVVFYGIAVHLCRVQWMYLAWYFKGSPCTCAEDNVFGVVFYGIPRVDQEISPELGTYKNLWKYDNIFICFEDNIVLLLKHIWWTLWHIFTIGNYRHIMFNWWTL